MLPTPGRIVLYRTDGRNGYKYDLPAMIVRTKASSDNKAVGDGAIHALPNDYTVDLFVFSVGGASYGENSVPYSEEAAQRSWRWPPRSA